MKPYHLAFCCFDTLILPHFQALSSVFIKFFYFFFRTCPGKRFKHFLLSFFFIIFLMIFFIKTRFRSRI